MAGPAFVTGQSAATSASGTSCNVTINGVTAGNMLVAVATTDDGTAPGTTAVADNKNGTWTRLVSRAHASVTRGSIGIYVMVNCLSGNTQITFTNGTAFVGMSVAEYTPGQVTADTSSSNTSISNTPPDAGSLVTTNADDLLVAGACDAVETLTFAAGTSYALRSVVNSNTNTNVGLQDRTVAATSTYASAFAASGTTSGWSAAAVAIKAAVAAAASFPFRPAWTPNNPILAM